MTEEEVKVRLKWQIPEGWRSMHRDSGEWIFWLCDHDIVISADGTEGTLSFMGVGRESHEWKWYKWKPYECPCCHRQMDAPQPEELGDMNVRGWYCSVECKRLYAIDGIERNP